MAFNSLQYFIFFFFILLVYYQLPHRWQNRLLLVASYFFYACWDWRFLFLILISTVTDYFCGIQIFSVKNRERKRVFLYTSIIINITLLGFFKYWDFFAENLASFLSILGVNASLATLQVILPVGLSFYTLKTMTYTIDIYRGEMKPTYNFVDYALFVSFFPQLIAGPIDRAKTLLPQIADSRQFEKDNIFGGLRLIFWGLFKKAFVADNLAIIVNQVYSNPNATGMQYAIATWAFAVQIYADFSGYSDMAVGSAKCFGIELSQNFRQPYFAIDPSDFWRRWHITLSSWLRDYLYIPLGGNRMGSWNSYRNLMVTMLLCGLWHGAGWTFLIWGAYHGILLCTYRLFANSRRLRVSSTGNLWIYMLKAFIMFQLISLGWIFFRAQSLDHIFVILKSFLGSTWHWEGGYDMLLKVVLFSALPLLLMGFEIAREIRPSWFTKGKFSDHFVFPNLPLPLRSALYGILTYLVCFHGASAQSFIYQQF